VQLLPMDATLQDYTHVEVGKDLTPQLINLVLNDLFAKRLFFCDKRLQIMI
jgi:hypothetical protein